MKHSTWFWAVRAPTPKIWTTKGKSQWHLAFESLQGANSLNSFKLRINVTFCLDSWKSTNQPWTCMGWSMHASFSLLVVLPWCVRSSSSECLAHASVSFVTDKSSSPSDCQKSYRRHVLKSTAHVARKCTFPARSTWTLTEPTSESASLTSYSRRTLTSTRRMDHSLTSLSSSDSRYSARKALLTKRNSITAVSPSTSQQKRSSKTWKLPNSLAKCHCTSSSLVCNNSQIPLWTPQNKLRLNQLTSLRIESNSCLQTTTNE